MDEPEVSESVPEPVERDVRAKLSKAERMFYVRWVYGKSAPKPQPKKQAQF